MAGAADGGLGCVAGAVQGAAGHRALEGPHGLVYDYGGVMSAESTLHDDTSTSSYCPLLGASFVVPWLVSVFLVRSLTQQIASTAPRTRLQSFSVFDNLVVSHADW